MLAVFVVVVTGLFFAREVMVPITLAVLLSFVLAPLVTVLRRIRLPRVPAVLLSVVLALGVILALASLIGVQVANLAGDLPRYQETVEAKLHTVQGLTFGLLSRVTDGVGRQIQHVATPPPAATGTPAAPKPVIVTVQPPPASPLQLAQEFLAPVLAPLATGAIVFVVAIFILLQQEDLRDRLIRLCGSSDLHRTTVALDDAGRRLSRYFLTQLGINTAFGCVICGGLLVIGVPSPVLWSVLGTLLRFVPYVWVMDFRLAANHARRRGRPRLDHGGMDGGALHRSRVVGGAGDRALPVWPQHRAVADLRRGRGDILVLALGSDRADPFDTAHPVPGGARPPCAPARVS